MSMSMSSITSRRVWSILPACGLAWSMAACSNSSTTNPSPDLSSNPTSSPPGVGALTVSVSPNPVPFSGQPITDAASCAGYENTWFYDQTLTETGGAAVTITARVDKFDDKVANNVTNLNMQVPAKGTLVVRSRWCSGAGTMHTAQTSFGGTDQNGNRVTVNGPTVRLMPR
jgi:hypothetical protein